MRRPFVEPFVQAESPYLHDWNTAWFHDDAARPNFPSLAAGAGDGPAAGRGMSLGRAWAVRDLGERTKAAREVRKAVRPGQAPDDDVLRNPGAPALPGRLARKTGHAVARVLGAGAHTVTASVTHAAHRVAKLTAVTHKSHIPAGRWHH